MASGLSAAAMTGFRPLLGPLSGEDRTWPRNVGQVREAAQATRTASMASGGGARLEEAKAWSMQAGGLLDRRYSPELAEACGWLWMTVGFACFDTGDYLTAGRLYRTAFAAAKQAANPSLQARILALRSRLDMDEMDAPLTAVQRCERGRALDGLTPAEHAMLAAIQARASAAMGYANEVDRLVGEATEHLTEARSGDREDRPWSAFYDWPHQHGDLAAAYTSLLWHGHRVAVQATSYQQQAIDGHAAGSRRSKAMSTVSLATTEVEAGDFDHGIALGHTALDSYASIDSWRLHRGFRDLSTALAGFPHQPIAADLAARIAEAA